MAINVEAYGGLLALSERQRQQTEARQDRWMYELEHAMLQSAKKPAPPKDGRAQATARDDAPLPQRQSRQDDLREPAESAALMVSAPAAKAQAGAPESAAAPAVTAGQGAGAAAQEHGATASRLAAATPAPAPAPVSAAAMPTTALPVASAAPSVSPLAAMTAMTPALAAAPGASRSLAAGAIPGADSAADNTIPAAPGGGWLGRGAEADGALLAAPEEAEAAPATPEPAPETASDQPYAARLLHVYRDADGVQAWLRDASLGQMQAQQLARAMAGELGSAGAPLTALTVNGRRQVLPGAPAADASQDEFTAEARPDAPALPYTLYQNGAL